MTDAWPTPPAPPSSGPPMGRTIAIVGAVLVVALLIVVGVVVLAGDDNGGDDPDGGLTTDIEGAGERASTRGRAPGNDPDDPDTSSTTEPEETTTTEPEDLCPTAGEVLDRDALPDPDVDADPLELEITRTGRNTEWPLGFGDDAEVLPYKGERQVGILPGEYTDVPVHLDAGQYAVIFAANDCIKGSVLVYAPSGELIATADDLGTPGTVEGYEFIDGDELTESGTYVFRVIQDTGTDDGSFPMRFYGPRG